MRTIIDVTVRPQWIKRILSINNVYDDLVYDGSPSLEDFVPTGVWLMLVDGEDIAGMINLQAMNNVMWTPHIFIFPLYRGPGSEQWGLQAVEYMKEKYSVEKFLAFTPYKSAKKYAERMGLSFVALLPKSIKKNGQLLNQYMLEMTC